MARFPLLLESPFLGPIVEDGGGWRSKEAEDALRGIISLEALREIGGDAESLRGRVTVSPVFVCTGGSAIGRGSLCCNESTLVD